MKAVLIIWDGLRPEFVDPGVTPALCALSDQGTTFSNHTAIFPTETRVNSSSIATGMYPDKPVWTTADGKAAFEALHLTSAAPSATGKYVIMIDPAKSDPGARVTVRFVDH